jgi:hypothetical protein
MHKVRQVIADIQPYAMMQAWTSVAAILSIAAAVHVPVARQTNDGVHLAITPTCGKLGGTVANTNAGIETNCIETLVAFGVCFSVLKCTAPLKGTVGFIHVGRAYRWRPASGSRPEWYQSPCRWPCHGRSCVGGGSCERLRCYNHGLCGVLDFLQLFYPLVLIISMKVSGAVVNVTLWPSKSTQTDFLHEGSPSAS